MPLTSCSSWALCINVAISLYGAAGACGITCGFLVHTPTLGACGAQDCTPLPLPYHLPPHSCRRGHGPALLICKTVLVGVMFFVRCTTECCYCCCCHSYLVYTPDTCPAGSGTGSTGSAGWNKGTVDRRQDNPHRQDVPDKSPFTIISEELTNRINMITQELEKPNAQCSTQHAKIKVFVTGTCGLRAAQCPVHPHLACMHM